MKQKSVIFDIDDTCLDFIGFTCKLHFLITGKLYKKEDITEWDLPTDLYATFKEYENWIYVSQPIFPKVIQTIDKLRKLDYKIILMTARPEVFKKHTQFNLALNKVYYDLLLFNKNKSLKINRLSEDYDIRIFCDDKLETVNKVKKGTQVPSVYLINTSANRNEDVEEGIIRINNIHEIKEVKWVTKNVMEEV